MATDMPQNSWNVLQGMDSAMHVPYRIPSLIQQVSAMRTLTKLAAIAIKPQVVNRRIRSFLNLSFPDQILLFQSLCLLKLITLLLHHKPLARVLVMLDALPKGRSVYQSNEKTYQEKVVWAVRLASFYVRDVRCLAQALATRSLLLQRGCSSNLRVGFIRNRNGQLSAHAWIEHEGLILIGETGCMKCYIQVDLRNVTFCNGAGWSLL